MKSILATLLATGVSVSLADPLSAQVVWSDEFDSGTGPDPRYWTHDLGDNGWGNQELQYYTNSPGNARVETGELIVTARRSDGEAHAAPFSSARIRTQDKVTFKYGTVEARISVPNLADGLWPAFWTLGNSFSEVGWPACGEIDIMEMGSGDAIADGSVNRRVGSAAHWENGDSWASYPMFLDAEKNLAGDFHVFRMDWTPEAITTYLDGKQVWSMDIRPEQCSACSEFHQPHFLIMNMAVGGRYTGLLTEGEITAGLPAEMRVDYIRIIDNGHTVLGGSAILPDLVEISSAPTGR